MKNTTLKYYDIKQRVKENIGFFKRLVNSSKKGFLISLIFIATLVLLDFTIKEVTLIFCGSYSEVLNRIADFIYKVNDLIGVKYLDYFKDVIVIVAGVLGVILGLFFTSFLNIITTKYSNLNSSIINQLLEQKTINRYFKLLAILVSSSIIFQFILILGYYPTLLSASIYSITVILTLISFIFFGRYSLIYFNAGYLVFDLLEENYNNLNRAYKNKKGFNTTNNKHKVIPYIKRNIEKVKLIVDESAKHNMTNTALDSISSELLSFSIHYNSYKHIIPSNNDWHIKIQKNKTWDEASSIDYQLNNKAGSFLLPKTVSDYNNIEKLIIDTQLFIFEQSITLKEKINLVLNQNKYIQVLAFQSDNELFEYFFNKLEYFIFSQIEKNKNSSFDERLQLISLFVTLIVQYLVGLNHNFQNIIKVKSLKKLAFHIHSFKNTDNIMNMPYAIRIWIDNYQEKLQNEKYSEGKIITPLFYTEYELSSQIQFIYKTHFEYFSQFIFKNIPKISKRLIKSELLIEALELNSESLELNQKIEFFSQLMEERISEINVLNLAKELNYNFKERDEILTKNESFRENIIKEMWNLGTSSYTIKSEVLPDIYGNFYNLIITDILNKALKEDPIELAEYIPKFYTYNILYIESLRMKIDPKRIEYTSSKLYPLIVDLFEVSSIFIIIFKITNNKEIEDSFFNYWNNVFGDDYAKEKKFWEMILPVYYYFNQPMLRMSTPSYVKEHDRKMKLESFLKNSSFVKIKEVKEGFMHYSKRYCTEVEDFYIGSIIDKLSEIGIGLSSSEISQLFIEYFLRTRISLKDLKIKETRYGSNLKRYVERDS